MEKNNNGKNTIIVLLLIIIVSLIAVLLLNNTNDIKEVTNYFTKITTKEEKTNNVEENNTNETNNSTNFIVTDLINAEIEQEWNNPNVTEDIKKSILGDNKPGLKLVLPKINLDTDGANSINTKIENDYKEYIDTINNQVKEQTTMKVYATNINYNYAVRENVVYIIINTLPGLLNGTGNSLYKGYYYDIDTKKEINSKQALEKLGITEKDLNDKINTIENLKDEYKNDLFSNIIIFPFGTNVEVLASDMSGFNGNLGEITELYFECK